jgi:hypothetical protein
VHVTPEFSLSRRDYVRAGRAMQNRRWVTWLVYGFFTFYIVAIFILDLWLSSRGRPIPLKTLVGAIGGAALILGLTYGWPALTVQHGFHHHSIAFKPQVWTLSEAGIKMSGPGHSTELAWSAVRRLTDDGHFFYFYLSDTTAVILPKRCLDPGAEATLRRDVRKWWSDRR